ncbi:MAG: PAS domain-containing protein [Gemmataceae bacterium]
MLRSVGYVVLRVDTAEDALRQAMLPVRLVIVEGQLASVVRLMRAEPILEHLPVILLGEGELSGPGQVVTRDIEGVALLEVVHLLLSRSPPQMDRVTLALLRKLFEGLHAHIAVLDTDGTILLVNEAWCRFARHNQTDAEPLFEGTCYFQVCSHYFGPESTETERFTQKLREVLQRTCLSFVHEYTWGTGAEQRRFVARVSRLQVLNTVLILLSHENGTTFHLVDQARSQDHLRLTALLDDSPDGYLGFSQEGDLFYNNPSAARFLGPATAPLDGVDLGQLVPEIDQEAVSLQEVERFLPASSCWIRLSVQPSQEGVLVVLRDITQLRAAQVQDAAAQASLLSSLRAEVAELRQVVSLSPPSREDQPVGIRQPALLATWGQAFGELLDLALEQRTYRIENQTSNRLRELAGRLGHAGASPRDVIDLYTQAIHSRRNQYPPRKIQPYLEEGRILLVELMGQLASFYRQHRITTSS